MHRMPSYLTISDRLPGCCDPFNDKALRASRGASFRLPVGYGNWAQLDTLLAHHKMVCLAGEAPSPGTNLVLDMLYCLILFASELAVCASVPLHETSMAALRNMKLGDKQHQSPPPLLPSWCLPVSLSSTDTNRYTGSRYVLALNQDLNAMPQPPCQDACSACRLQLCLVVLVQATAAHQWQRCR